MELWFMDAEKKFINEYWSNRYVIQANSLADALVTAAAIRLVERNCTIVDALLTKYRVSSDNVGDDVYQIIDDNVAGLKSTDGSQALPLFCRVHCVFNTVGGGRPSRKYWCPPVLESENASGTLTPTAIDFFQTNYVEALLALENFVDVDGQQFSSGSVRNNVGMRQLRRGSKRRLLPIIP